MPVIGLYVEAGHLGIGDPYRLGVTVLIQFATDREAGFGRGGGDVIASTTTKAGLTVRCELDTGGPHELWQLPVCSVAGVKRAVLKSGRPPTPAAMPP